jgi:hypothetical protein
MTKNSVVVVGCIFVILLSASSTQAADASKTLKDAVNSKSYILVDPAESWPYPGGLLVTLPNAKTATFIDIPQALKPTATSEAADFLARSKTSKFTLSAILTGMASIITGNPGAGFGHSSNTKVDQINATVTKITFQDAQGIVRSHDDVKGTVRNWLNSGYEVMVVGVAATTNKISVTTNSSTNLDISFNGSTVSKCSDSSGDSNKSNSSANNSDSSGSGTSGSSSAGSGASSGTQSGANSGQNSPSSNGTNSGSGSSAASPQSKSSPSSSLPGGELHLCISGSSSVALNSDKPLVFAVAAYRAQFVKDANGTIVKDASGQNDVDLQPAFSLPPGGQAENTEAGKKCPSGQNPNECKVSVKVASAVPSHWTKALWGEPIK